MWHVALTRGTLFFPNENDNLIIYPCTSWRRYEHYADIHQRTASPRVCFFDEYVAAAAQNFIIIIF